jgi:DNA-binding transcriptional ArsR family regulator
MAPRAEDPPGARDRHAPGSRRRHARNRLAVALSRPVPDPLVDLIARRLQALAQPTPIRLLERLDAHGEQTVQALVQAVGVTPYNASRHLAALQLAGVVHRRPRGKHALHRLADPTVMPLYELVARGLAEAYWWRESWRRRHRYETRWISQTGGLWIAQLLVPIGRAALRR